MAGKRNIAIWVNIAELRQLSSAAADRRVALMGAMQRVNAAVRDLDDARSVKADLTDYLRAYDVTQAVERRIDDRLIDAEVAE